MRRLADLILIALLCLVLLLYASTLVSLDAANHEIDNMKVQAVEQELRQDGCDRERLRWLHAVEVLGAYPTPAPSTPVPSTAPPRPRRSR